MRVLSNPIEVQEQTRAWKDRVAFVPTMGALHAGHLELVRIAKAHAPKVVVSIFVNPLQFGPNEDLAKYPRTLDADLAGLRELSVDLVFVPTIEDLYPAGHSTRIQVGKLGAALCGRSRPGHFEGVATVCLKLFHITGADLAVFGEKDFQQVRVLEQMVSDLNLSIELVRAPIVREPDGLAMSSRNRYLSEDERKLAAGIPETMAQLRRVARAPNALVADIVSCAREGLRQMDVEYLEVCSESTLLPEQADVPLSKIPSPHFFLAVKIGRTRLIDNMPLHREIS